MPVVAQENGLIDIFRAGTHCRCGCFCGSGKAAIVAKSDLGHLMPLGSKRFKKILFVLLALARDQIDVGV
jgi:hypothetical protein